MQSIFDYCRFLLFALRFLPVSSHHHLSKPPNCVSHNQFSFIFNLKYFSRDRNIKLNTQTNTNIWLKKHEGITQHWKNIINTSWCVLVCFMCTHKILKTLCYTSSFIWLILCKQKLGFNINWRHLKLIHGILKIICILSVANSGDVVVMVVVVAAGGWYRFSTTSYAHFYAFWTITTTIACISSSEFRRQCRWRWWRRLRWFCTLPGDRNKREMFVVFVNLKPLANIWLCVHIIYWNIGIVLMKDLTF